MQAAFGAADIAVQLLQHFNVELLLAPEVVIDHAFGGMNSLGDGVHARAGQPLLNELDNGFLKNILAGLFRVVLATLARLDLGQVGRYGEVCGHSHSGLMAITAQTGDYGPHDAVKEAPSRPRAATLTIFLQLGLASGTAA
ncbi:hypothetical protein D3C80_1478700 [compost metagenome]